MEKDCHFISESIWIEQDLGDHKPFDNDLFKECDEKLRLVVLSFHQEYIDNPNKYEIDLVALDEKRRDASNQDYLPPIELQTFRSWSGDYYPYSEVIVFARKYKILSSTDRNFIWTFNKEYDHYLQLDTDHIKGEKLSKYLHSFKDTTYKAFYLPIRFFTMYELKSGRSIELKKNKIPLQRKSYAFCYHSKYLNKNKIHKRLLKQHDDIQVLVIGADNKCMIPRWNVYLEFKKRKNFKNINIFDIDDIKSEMFQFRKSEWLNTILDKDDKAIEDGIDLEKYLQSTRSKTNKQFLKATNILINGGTYDDIVKIDPVLALKEKRKLEDFETHLKQKKRKLTIDENIKSSSFLNIKLSILPDYNEEMKSIVDWINFRLVDGHFNKHWSGLYLWSKKLTVQKNSLCKILGLVYRTYEWDTFDRGWHQRFDKDSDYKLVVFNALNKPNIPFNLIEKLGDREDITIAKRCQTDQPVLPPKIPFMITSNKHPTKLGYRDVDMNVWMERMLVIEITEQLIPLVEQIKKIYEIQMKDLVDVPLPNNVREIKHNKKI